MSDWYKITNFLKPFSKPLNVKILCALNNEQGSSRNLTLTKICDQVQEQENKVYNYCKSLLTLGYINCSNDALTETDRGYIKQQGKVPKFELSPKGLAICNVFNFILNYENRENLEFLKKQIQIGGILNELEEDIFKILTNIKKFKEEKDTRGEE